MQRLFISLIAYVSFAVSFGAAPPARALDPAPLASIVHASSGLLAQTTGQDKWNDSHSISRPQASGVVLWKVGLFILIFICWVRTTDWVNRDCQLHNLGYVKWNSIAFFPVAAALLLALVLPYVIGLSILVLVYLSVFIAYIIVHNQSVPQHEKVLTRAWWRFFFAGILNKLGMKIAAERIPDYEKGPPVDLKAQGAANERENQILLIQSRQLPGYVSLKELIADMLAKRSDRILLEYTPQSAAQQYQIDGVWHKGDAREREPADSMLAAMKILANLDINERKKHQSGTIGVKYQGHSYRASLESQGTQTAERVLFSLEDNRLPFKELDDLGMRDKIRDLWIEHMGADQGMLIMATLPGGGLTTLIDASIEDTDRLMRDWASVEDVHHREREIENVEVTTYDSAKGETPATVLPALIRKYPNVYVIRDLVNVETAQLLFDEIRDERLVITSVRSKDAPEALLRLIAKKIPKEDFSEVVSAVLYERLVRKLCPECKIGYEPTPDILQKLGIPQGRVPMLYRAPKPEEIDKPCEKCHGIGFHGRTGIFELLEVNAEIRKILAKQPTMERLRPAARATGMRTLQEEGILLVAKGITSLPELTRVLKQ
ncbi:MAG: Flp pilus assembly complex ATPase component TadA [Pirellulales bacterium]|nr:Flp pilus assembly complex ATPase component TadA [Pirellulales bacterium]